MSKSVIASLVAGGLIVLASAPASAADWSEKISLCAAAVEAEGLAEVENYRVKFSSGASRKLTIKLIPNEDGETLTAECRMRRGEVSSVTLKQS